MEKISKNCYKGEYNTCKAISDYLRLVHPKVLFHWDLAGLNLSRAQSGMMKAIQHSKGWPDLMIFHPTNGKILFLEIKGSGVKLYKKNGDPVSDHINDQIIILKFLTDLGHRATFSIGAEESIDLIEKFLKND